jgi:hypothetical protein
MFSEHVVGSDVGGVFSGRARSKPSAYEWESKMDAGLLIGAPLGLGVLIALGILMVAMAYLAQ